MRVKFLNLSLCLTMICMAMTTLWSCSDSDDNTTPDGSVGNADGKLQIEVSDPDPDKIGATSAEFKMTVSGVESYVTKVVEGANATQPDPVLVYKEAEDNGTIKKVSESSFTETVSGLEGNKAYSIFFVFKTKEGFELVSKQLTTAKYTQKVTILETGMFHIKLHVEVPEDEYYSIGCMMYENYMSFKAQYGYPDIAFITQGSNGGLKNPRFKGPQTITIKDGEFMYKGALNEQEMIDAGINNEDDYNFFIKPGTAYAIFMGQCDEQGETSDFVSGKPEGGVEPGPLNASVVPNVKEYTEEILGNGDMKFTGDCAKTVVFTQQAAQGNGKVDIRVDRTTEKTAIVSFLPSDEVLKYAVLTIDNAKLEEIYALCAGEEGMQAMTLNYGTPVEGEQQATIPLEAGHSYSIYVTAVYNEESTIQTQHKYTNLKPIVSDKPASELEIKPLNLNDPYKVGYNIRAVNGDCLGFKFLMNYVNEWYPMLNSLGEDDQEANIASMMAQYAAGVNDKETMALVNSAKGFDIVFSSIDDMESWLVVESYNADEKTKLYWKGDNLRVKSAALTPETKVETELYDKMKGTWEATMTRVSGNTTPVKMDITIGDAPKKVETLPNDVKDKLVNFYMTENGFSKEKAETMVTETFKEYKTLQQKYTDKYAGQNLLVGTGFSYDNYYSKFADSWDLFQSTSYSAVSTEEMFRDYGPKLFFKFEKDEKGNVIVYVPTTHKDEKGDYIRYIDPVTNWSMAIDLFGFNKDQANAQFMTDFPVEISKDFNTITIKPREENGVKYTPSFAMQYQTGSTYTWGFQTNDEGIVLKRKLEPTVSRAAAVSAPVTIPELKMHQGNYFRRTRAPYGFTVKEPMQLNVFSMDSLHKNAK